MEFPYRPLKPSDIAFSSGMNHRILYEVLDEALRAETDADALERKKTAYECRLCFYIYKYRVGGAAMTTSYCGVCASPMGFGSTNVDRVCEQCAREHDLCKHCGADRELRKGRRKFPEPVTILEATGSEK